MSQPVVIYGYIQMPMVAMARSTELIALWCKLPQAAMVGPIFSPPVLGFEGCFFSFVSSQNHFEWQDAWILAFEALLAILPATNAQVAIEREACPGERYYYIIIAPHSDKQAHLVNREVHKFYYTVTGEKGTDSNCTWPDMVSCQRALLGDLVASPRPDVSSPGEPPCPHR